MGAPAKQKRSSKGMENTHASYRRFYTHADEKYFLAIVVNLFMSNRSDF